MARGAKGAATTPRGASGPVALRDRRSGNRAVHPAARPAYFVYGPDKPPADDASKFRAAPHAGAETESDNRTAHLPARAFRPGGSRHGWRAGHPRAGDNRASTAAR